MLENAKFRSASDENTYMSLEEALKQAIDYIKEEPQAEYDVIVGSDSLWRAWHTVFATVFAVHRKGKGARFWYTKSKEKYPKNIPVRLMREAADSVELMQALYDSEIMLLVPEDNFSVHVDVGQKGESRQVINEVLGYVQGQGFHCEHKPNAAVGSICADRITK